MRGLSSVAKVSKFCCVNRSERMCSTVFASEEIFNVSFCFKFRMGVASAGFNARCIDSRAMSMRGMTRLFLEGGAPAGKKW